MLSVEECRFWNGSIASWDARGCELTVANLTHLVCLCGSRPAVMGVFKTQWRPAVVLHNPFAGTTLFAFNADPLTLPVFCTVCAVFVVYLLLARLTFRAGRARQHQKMMQRLIQQRLKEKNGSIGLSKQTPSIPDKAKDAWPRVPAQASKYLKPAKHGGELTIAMHSARGARGRIAGLLQPQLLICSELNDMGVLRQHVWAAVWLERPGEVVTRLQRLTVLLVIVMTNISVTTALFGVSRCRPKQRSNCYQNVNGCDCNPEPDEISWARVVITALLVSILMLPVDRMLLGMWEIVEERTWAGEARGPGRRKWTLQDFASSVRSIVLVQSATRAFVARNDVALIRKLEHSRRPPLHDMQLLALPSPEPEEAAPPPADPPPAKEHKLWVRRRPFNSHVIDDEMAALARLIGSEDRTTEEVVRGAVTVQRWFRRHHARRTERWQQRVHASRQPPPGLATGRAPSARGARRVRSNAVAPAPEGPAERIVRKRREEAEMALPPWFGRLLYWLCFVWSAGCGVYSVAAAAYYPPELASAWAHSLLLGLCFQIFVADAAKAVWFSSKDKRPTQPDHDADTK